MSSRLQPFLARSRYLASETSEALAARALSMVALRAAEGREAPEAPWIGRLVDSAMSGTAAPLAAVVEQMRVARVPSEAIVDILIPAAVREIGVRWADDRAGFAQVSVASARLQSVMRDVMRSHMTMPYASGGVLPQAVLVVVPEREQHTIGALAVASQLGRAGLEPVLSLGEPRMQLRTRLQAERFAAVCLSLSRHESLDTAQDLVNTIRHLCGYPVRVMIGGAALEAGGMLGVQTGADAITNDLREALRLCGLKISMQGDGRSATVT